MVPSRKVDLVSASLSYANDGMTVIFNLLIIMNLTE